MSVKREVFDQWWESLPEAQRESAPATGPPPSIRAAIAEAVSKSGGLPSIRGSFRDPTWDEW